MTSRLLAAALALFSAITTLRAQVFDAGYTFTYHFHTLHSVQTGGVPLIETGFNLTPEFQFLTATIQYELFDSQPVGTPVYSGVWNPGDYPYVAFNGPTWLDGEGSFRISILSGSQLIQSCDTYLYYYNPKTELFTILFDSITTAPVPEPATFAFLAIGFVFLTLWRRRVRIV